MEKSEFQSSPEVERRLAELEADLAKIEQELAGREAGAAEAFTGARGAEVIEAEILEARRAADGIRRAIAFGKTMLKKIRADEAKASLERAAVGAAEHDRQLVGDFKELAKILRQLSSCLAIIGERKESIAAFNERAIAAARDDLVIDQAWMRELDDTGERVREPGAGRVLSFPITKVIDGLLQHGLRRAMQLDWKNKRFLDVRPRSLQKHMSDIAVSEAAAELEA